MSKIITHDDDDFGFNDDMTPEDFDRAVRKLALFANSVVRRGVALWRLAERKGWDTRPLAAIAGGVIAYVVGGGLVPEAAEKFFGHSDVIEDVRRLPPAVQVELAAGKTIPVVDPVNPEKVYQRTIPEMTKQERKRVIVGSRILTEVDQRTAMSPPSPPRNGHSKPKVNPPLGINKPPPDVDSEYVVERGRLTKDQQQRLHENAARAGVPVWLLIWTTLNNAGLL